jgi:uroporphyrinogen-III synthase
MIPYVLPPLTGLHILVTRPAHQAESLNHRLSSLGAHITALPALDIIANDYTPPNQTYDLLIFISSNAVHLGQSILAAQPQARIAAVGKRTADALLAAGHQVDIAPEAAASSEVLLNHPLLMNPPKRILIVRGVGGRELLQETLTQRGSQVDVVEVYRRIPHQPEPQQLQLIQSQLADDLIDLITLTSVEVVHAVHNLLGSVMTQRDIPFLAGSTRIAQAAQALGWEGETILAHSPEDEQLISALTRWHTRARTDLLR